MENFPDKDARTVSIPIKVIKGQVRMLYGGICLPLVEGYTGDLILPAAAVRDEVLLNLLESESTVEALPAFSIVLLAMRDSKIPPERSGDVFILPHSVHASGFAFAPVVLTEPLRLFLRGTKSAQLLGGRCWVPALHHDAISLNHAYTILSTVLEPSRRAHTGNVFDRARYHKEGQWWKLDDLRGKHEAAREQEIIKHLTPKKQEPVAQEPPTPATQVALDLGTPLKDPDTRQDECDTLADMIYAHREPQADHKAIDAIMQAFIADCYHLKPLQFSPAEWLTGR